MEHGKDQEEKERKAETGTHARNCFLLRDSSRFSLSPPLLGTRHDRAPGQRARL